MTERSPSPSLARVLGFKDLVLIVVGTVIGSGIFLPGARGHDSRVGWVCKTIHCSSGSWGVCSHSSAR